ncbi:unnamed protein product [Cuscuta campestris]|uniref:Reverse transcriptase domain-containing protein n=1 Tax=Cuscuta campestris TaxID=132261 RepID=A0A484MZQ0_9ASTE|nr:unnamed protein product [Cuscuta campestris]
MFRMKEGGKIDDMFDRFSKIINNLHSLKKTYANKDLVRKILRSLTPEWRSKADAIYESIGVSNVTIDGLTGNLKTYESTILTPSLDEQKKKGIALKATKETVEEVSSDDDNEFGLVIKKFHKFMKKEFERKGRKHDGTPKCYGCGEIGHIKPRCLKGKSGKDKPGFKKQRAYISWGGDSGDESTDQEEEEAANLCLMAHEDHADKVQEGRFEVKESGSQGEPAMGGLHHRWEGSSLFFRTPLPIDGSTNLYDIEIDLPTFARITGLPIRGDDIATYGGNDWILNNEAVVIRELGITNLIRHSGAPTIHSAPPDERLLLYIITRILHPRDSSHTSLFNEDLKAIHAIMHGASINWAKFIMIHMADCASIATEGSLPYAFLVMDLIVSADIHIVGPSTKMTKLWVIADTTFKKKSGDHDGTGPSRARAPAPAPARASLQSIADTLNRLTLTVDDMGQYMERMDWTLQRQHHDMTAFFRYINYVPPPFDGTILGQNFEGEDEEDDSYAPSSSPDEADFEDAVDGDPMDVEDEDADTQKDTETPQKHEPLKNLPSAELHLHPSTTDSSASKQQGTPENKDYQDEIHEEILNYYNTLFMYKESHNDRFTSNIPNLITQMDNSSLTSLPDENEVKEDVWSLSADSAAGPDGFNGHFYKTCWEQIKVDCTKVVQEFFLGIPIPKICAQTTIILIPKKENSQSCEDYRPICLSNFCCKIFSKILSQRLSSILPRLISPEQGGFVKGRVIHDQETLSPLSPLLFILASEAFSRTIKKETTSGALSPYYLGRHYTPITHLAFADDLILFTKGDSPTVTSIKLLLSDYEDCSGQQINRGKCSFYIPKKTPLATQRRIQTILGMNKGILPFKYLGIQIHHGINRKPYCNDILNLFDSKLKGWYHKLLSQSGRLTLIKHVLNTMPLHMLGCSKLPKSIIKCLHSKMNNFLWGHDKDNKKYHWSSWEKLCFPKDEGGLGITDLNTLQLAYGFKMWWTYTQNNFLWANFMRARYPRGLSIAPKIIDSVYWKRLYEVNSMEDNHLSIDTQGRILWHNGEVGFSLKKAKNSLREKQPNHPFTKLSWNSKQSPKHSIFLWKLCFGYLPLPHSLTRLGFQLPSVCFLCRNSDETTTHLFRNCPFSNQIWNYFEQIFSICRNTSHGILTYLTNWWKQVPELTSKNLRTSSSGVVIASSNCAESATEIYSSFSNGRETIYDGSLAGVGPLKVASLLGKPINVDSNTSIGVYPSKPRFCVERDLSLPFPDHIHIRLGSKHIRVPCGFENPPAYCSFCSIFGHSTSACRKRSGLNLTGVARFSEVGHIGEGKSRDLSVWKEKIALLIPQRLGLSQWMPLTAAPIHYLSRNSDSLRCPVKLTTWRPEANPVRKSLGSEFELQHLPRACSDHKALLLSCSVSSNKGPLAFRFLNPWIHHTNFIPVVKECWTKSPIVGGMHGLVAKLKDLKTCLKAWNMDEFGHILDNLKNADIYANTTQQLYEDNPTEANRIRNSSQIRDAAITHFSSQIMAHAEPPPLHNLSHIPSLLSEMENTMITALPTLEEVKNAVWDLDSNSASGPDGYNGLFFRTTWDIIKEDMLKASKEIFLGKTFGGNVIVKIDMAKAFDTLRWDNLGANLLQFGFSNKAASLLMAKLRGRMLSVLINGQPAGYFPMTRGVKQGDPLSPLLFVIASEGLSRLLNRSMEESHIHLYNMGSVKFIGHLTYADDIMIFTKGDSINLLKLRKLLDEYSSDSGQVINSAKSKFYVKETTNSTHLQNMEKILGMHLRTLPFTYLGATIYKGQLKKYHCGNLMDHFDKHIHSWMANFFWGRRHSSQLHHWKSWKNLCQPSSAGGLDIKDLHTLQQNQLINLWWRVNHDTGVLANTMQAIYMRKGTIKEKLTDSTPWKRICRVHSFVVTHINDSVQPPLWDGKPFSSKNILLSLYGVIPSRLSCKYIWHKSQTPKLRVFQWKAFMNSLPFPELTKRFSSCLSSQCLLCKQAEDSLDHTLGNCKFGYQVWKYFCTLIDAPMSAPNLKLNQIFISW